MCEGCIGVAKTYGKHYMLTLSAMATDVYDAAMMYLRWRCFPHLALSGMAPPNLPNNRDTRRKGNVLVQITAKTFREKEMMMKLRHWCHGQRKNHTIHRDPGMNLAVKQLVSDWPDYVRSTQLWRPPHTIAQLRSTNASAFARRWDEEAAKCDATTVGWRSEPARRR